MHASRSPANYQINNGMSNGIKVLGNTEYPNNLALNRSLDSYDRLGLAHPASISPNQGQQGAGN
jgi:hypothetical protein